MAGKVQNFIKKGDKKMVYEWKVKGIIKTNADVAGTVCKQLQDTVGLTKETLVDASRPDNAPLHKEFEWNDAIAAEEYRREQAGLILRTLVIKDEQTNNEPVRAFFPIQITDGEKQYIDTQTIVSNAKTRTALLDVAIRELNSFKKKYAVLKELVKVFEAIDSLSRI